MQVRERFLKVMNYEKVDKVPNFDFGYWPETIKRWHKEGLPTNIDDQIKCELYFGLEGVEQIVSVPISVSLYPHFEEKVIEDKGEHVIIQDKEGVLFEKSKTSASIPKYLKFPIETKEDWERFKKERLDPDSPGRVPEDELKELKECWRNRGYITKIYCGSLYGCLRNWMGLENISIKIIEDPVWIEEMMEHLTNLSLKVLERTFEVLGDVKIDCSWWWEDMCFNKGPLISPKLFEKLMVPRYKRIVSFLEEKGIKIHIVDCDGKIDELVPLWLEAGINCMFPIEVACNDPIELRKKYGKRCLMIGGVDKRALIKGKKAIDEELNRLKDLVKDGGFIPCVDHRVPPDVSLENYLYYLRKKEEILLI